MSGTLTRARPREHDGDGASEPARPDTSPLPRTVRDSSLRWRRRLLLATLGFVVFVVISRGVVEIIRGPDRDAAPAAAKAFPSPEVSSFATLFARAYFTFSPTRPDAQVAALRPLLTSSLRQEAAVVVPSTGRAQAVRGAWFARARDLPGDRALVTVAVLVQRRGLEPSLRYIAVPVARDRNGGLIVDDYPSFPPPPPRADAVAPAPLPMTGPDATAIEALLTRFLPAYLSGRAVAPEFLAPGVRLTPLAHRYAFEELVSVGVPEGADAGSVRHVLVLVRVRDDDTSAAYQLRYHIKVVLRDRWLVASLQG